MSLQSVSADEGTSKSGLIEDERSVHSLPLSSVGCYQSWQHRVHAAAARFSL